MNSIKIVDAFISVIILLVFDYGLNGLIYIKFSRLFFTPSYLAYGILGFSFSIFVAVSYLLARKHKLDLRSYLIKGKNEFTAIVLGSFSLILINYVQKVIGLSAVDPAFLAFFNADHPYRLFTITYAVVLAPLMQQTFFLGFFFENLRKNWGTSIAALATLSSLLLFYFSTLNGITPAIFLIIFQMVFLISYIRGGLGSAILIHSFLNIYLYYSAN